MTRPATIFLLCCLVLPLVAQDAVYYTDGRTDAGLVEELTGGYLVLQPAQAGQALRRIDVRDVATVRFGTRPEMTRADAARGNERLELLRRVWYLLRPSIGLPESPAGEWGLQFATAILDSDVPDHVRLSFEVFQTVEGRDWNRGRRHAARRGRFNAMLNLGMMDEAMAEARRVADDPAQEDPELLILARMMLGDLARKQMIGLEKEHPRWEQDDQIRPRRNALHDTAMDHYLYAHLRHGDRPEQAAKGLWAAIQLMRHNGNEVGAAARAGDLCALYPGTVEAALAGPLAAAGEDRVAVDAENSGRQRDAEPSSRSKAGKSAKEPTTKTPSAR